MEMRNIIGEFLDINQDIYSMKSTLKLVENIKKCHYRNKLISEAEKLKNINCPLDKNNLVELITHVYASYIPDGKFGCFKNIRYYENSASYIASIAIDSYSATIKISNISEYDKKFNISIFINGKRENKSFTVDLEEMKSANREINTYLEILNKALLSTMVDYIISILKSYEGKENEI